jgi:hypothetical protein
MQKTLDSFIGDCRRKWLIWEMKSSESLAEQVEKIIGGYINLIEAILSKS